MNQNKRPVHSICFGLLAICFLVLLLPIFSQAAYEKTVMIDGVRYDLDPSGTAEASLEYLPYEPDIDGKPRTEVTIHDEITYEGKTFTVRFIDECSGSLRETISSYPSYDKYPSYYQKHLRKITFEAGIDWLGLAFANYRNLEEVIIENPKALHSHFIPFYNCPKLKDIYIPADVDYIPLLRGCPDTNVTFAPDHPKYKTIGGDVYSKDGKWLYNVPEGSKNYTVKKSVKFIGTSAFYGNNNIRHIKIPSSVKRIYHYSFGDMKNLKSVKIGKNVKEIGDSAFRRSTKLKSLTFPKSVRILWGGFGGKSLCKLKTLYIKAPKLKAIHAWGLPNTCKVYVVNSRVRNQIRKAGFKGRIITKR